jgi:hypothetical protein
MTDKQQPPKPMKEPMKQHGDKMDADKNHGAKANRSDEPAVHAPHGHETNKLAEDGGDERTPEKTIGQIKYADMNAGDTEGTSKK